MDEGQEIAAALQQRARLIGESATFRNEGDAVPIAGSVAVLFDIRDDGQVRRSDLNILGENYWGIAKVLSR